MLSLEQVQLLEDKVAKAIEFVKRVSAENAALSSERASLITKLEANQKRLDELELLVMRFKEDQGRIEDGIIAALDRLSQFEEAFENGLQEKGGEKKTAPKKEKKPEPAPGARTAGSPAETSESKKHFEISEEDAKKNAEDGSEVSEAELDIF